MKNFICMLFFFTGTVTMSRAQVAPAAKVDFCTVAEKAPTSFIGSHAKITNAGSVYSTLNDSDSQTWPSAEIKKLGGRSGWKKYVPAVGDTGTIVHVFMSKGSKPQPIYLLKVTDKYVPVACGGISIEP